MKKSLVFIALVTFSVFVLFEMKDLIAKAQVTSGPVMTSGPSIDPLSAEEKVFIQNIKDIADRIETAMAEKEPKWKLKKKFSPRLSRSMLPPEKGGGELKGFHTNFQFKKGGTVAYVNFGFAEPSTVEEVAAGFKFRLGRRARGIAKDVAAIGDEAVLMMDLPGTPSTATNLYFRKGKFDVNVDVTNQSRTRERNEVDAKRIGKIIDPLIF